MLINHGGGNKSQCCFRNALGIKARLVLSTPKAEVQPNSVHCTQCCRYLRTAGLEPFTHHRNSANLLWHIYAITWHQQGNFQCNRGKGRVTIMGWDARAGEQHLHWRKHPVRREMCFFLCSSCGAVINLEPPSAGGAVSPAPAARGAHGVWGCARRVLRGAGPGTQPCSSFAALQQLRSRGCPWAMALCRGAAKRCLRKRKETFL